MKIRIIHTGSIRIIHTDWQSVWIIWISNPYKAVPDAFTIKRRRGAEMKGLTAETMTTSTLTTGHSLAARRERRNERRPLDGVRKQNTKTKKRNISRNVWGKGRGTTFYNFNLGHFRHFTKMLGAPAILLDAQRKS